MNFTSTMIHFASLVSKTTQVRTRAVMVSQIYRPPVWFPNSVRNVLVQAVDQIQRRVW